MKRLIRLTLASFIVTLGFAATPLLVAPAQAINVFEAPCGDSPDGEAGEEGVTPDAAPGPAGEGGSGSSSSICGAAKQDEAPNIIKNVINTILFILGMVAVIMIIIGGIRYTTSNGDSGQIKSAKDTILYAIVGLVIAIMSYAIVNFVVERLS